MQCNDFYGKQICHFYFASLLNGAPLKGKNLLPYQQLLSFMSRSLTGRASFAMEALSQIKILAKRVFQTNWKSGKTQMNINEI